MLNKTAVRFCSQFVMDTASGDCKVFHVALGWNGLYIPGLVVSDRSSCRWLVWEIIAARYDVWSELLQSSRRCRVWTLELWNSRHWKAASMFDWVYGYSLWKCFDNMASTDHEI